jgi:hypothetical protein
MNRLRADETFFAIRSRRLGDLDRSGSLGGSEKAIYLNSTDRDADRAAGIAPYAAGSRAITVRLDEMIFLASATGGGLTAQRTPPGESSPGAADAVRIYYGHGLRPPRDSRLDPLQPRDASWRGNVPARLWFPDGDFGDRSGLTNPRAPAGAPALFQVTQGRNEFAGDWLLLRQPMLLAGGLAAGYASSTPSTVRASWSYTPYLRSYEATRRAWSGFGTPSPLDDLANATPTPASGVPYARLMHHGRVDLCPQSLTDVRRWLEGMPAAVALAQAPDATAFTGGALDDVNEGSGWSAAAGDTLASNKVDAPLWQRRGGASLPAHRTANHQSLISAIAGCFARFQAEDDPPLIDRGASITSDAVAFDPPEDHPQTRFSAVMDLHAVIASRVSNFEIAWSDGRTWPADYGPYDRNGDGDTADADDLRAGDTIWYDMDFARTRNSATRDLAEADTGNYFGTRTESDAVSPEVIPGLRTTYLDLAAGNPVGYDPVTTGADPDPDGAGEYLAVFPFRTADTTGRDWEGAYAKPRRIRVRLTVHDAQYRIPGGRQYEFEFAINLQ